MFKNVFINVFTVDSYQGEENDIILLSMVRSNNFGSIGFLENQNRVVVALSRARCGLYIFGNAACLMATEGTENSLGSRSGLYKDILLHMRNNKQLNVDCGLPITCVKHGQELYVGEAEDFLQTNGGCNMPCDGILLCGHPCPAFCHIFSHGDLVCPEPCPKILHCGHGCSEICGNTCKCDQCTIELTVDKGGIENWSAWDAEKADQAIAQIAFSQEADVARADQQKLVYNETWRPIRISNDGVRIKAGSAVRTVISRVDGVDAISHTDEENFPALPKTSLQTGGHDEMPSSPSNASILRIVSRTRQAPTRLSAVRPRVVPAPQIPEKSAALVAFSNSTNSSSTKPGIYEDIFSFPSPRKSTDPISQKFADLEGLDAILPSFPDLEGLSITAPTACFDLEACEATTQVAPKDSSSTEPTDTQILIQF